jgi:hypothetical protein
MESNRSHRTLYSEFAGARFADVISLNFDRRIALSSARTRFVSAPTPCPEGTHGEPLYRHDRIEHSKGPPTRVWYPHGDTKKFSTLKLGVRRYGFYVGSLEETTSGYGESWRVQRAYYQQDRVDRAKSDALRWIDVFLSRPLAFIGCGLTFDEWPFWFMLRDRAEQRRQVPAYYLASSKLPGDRADALQKVGVTVLEFHSRDQLWDVIRSCLH